MADISLGRFMTNYCNDAQRYFCSPSPPPSNSLKACTLPIHMDVIDDGYDACIDHAFFLRANRRDLVKLETMGMYCWWVGKSELMAMVSALIF